MLPRVFSVFDAFVALFFRVDHGISTAFSLNLNTGFRPAAFCGWGHSQALSVCECSNLDVTQLISS